MLKRRQKMTKNSAVTWLENTGKTLSPLGEKVAAILGEVYAGIYHIDDEVRHKRVEWDNLFYIEVVVNHTFSTFDSANLTQLVILCHDNCVRLDIGAKAHKYVFLGFSARDGREGSMSQRHPTIEQAIKTIRGEKDD
jgi:hypothetical protein